MVTQEESCLLNCWIMLRVHLDGTNTCVHVGSSFTANPILQGGLIAGGRGPEEGRLTIFFNFVDPTAEEDDNFRNPRKSHYQNRRTHFSGGNPLGQLGKSTRQRDYESGRPDLALSSFMTQCRLTALRKGEAPEESLTPRVAPKIVLKNALASAARQAIKQRAIRVLRDLFNFFSVYKEYHRMQYLKMKGLVAKIEDLVHMLRTQSRTESVIGDLE